MFYALALWSILHNPQPPAIDEDVKTFWWGLEDAPTTEEVKIDTQAAFDEWNQMQFENEN